MTSSAILNLFSLNTGSGIPIYRQLIDQIKQAIRMNLLTANEQLPSVRMLANALQINPMTISKAFAQLEIEGVLVRKRGVGMLVAAQQKGSSITQDLEQPLIQFIKNARNEHLSDDEIFTIVQQYLSIHKMEQ
ncbi:MAG: GntR family transcriptional regulator [Marinicella sp.]